MATPASSYNVLLPPPPTFSFDEPDAGVAQVEAPFSSVWRRAYPKKTRLGKLVHAPLLFGGGS